MVKLIRFEPYQAIWRHIGIPQAIAIYGIPSHLPCPPDLASIFEALIGKPRFIEYRVERFHRRAYWDMAAAGDWAMVPPPRAPMPVSMIDERGYTFPSAGIIVFWTAQAFAMARLMIEEI